MAYKEIVMSAEEARRFWALVDRCGEDECWLWRGAIFRGNGYGRVSMRHGVSYTASRVAWAVTNGCQPDGFVCHRCDTPLCVNPAHLFLGTHADNMRDMVAKGRGGHGRPPGVNLKTHCKRGHEFDAANTYWRNGHRWCRACGAIRAREIKERKAA